MEIFLSYRGLRWVSCSAFYKPQAMNNINDCAIQSLTRACKNRDRERLEKEL